MQTSDCDWRPSNGRGEPGADQAWPLWLEGRAPAALGREDEVAARVDACLALPARLPPAAGQMMVVLGDELRVHGREDAARALFARAVAWHEARPPAERARRSHRAGLGFALLAAERRPEAEAIFRSLADEDPQNVAYNALLGVLAARSGDGAEADRIAGWLMSLEPRYRKGEPFLWRACMAAHGGQTASAVSLFREAASRAAHFPHALFCLDPVRAGLAFREMVRPRG